MNATMRLSTHRHFGLSKSRRPLRSDHCCRRPPSTLYNGFCSFVVIVVGLFLQLPFATIKISLTLELLWWSNLVKSRHGIYATALLKSEIHLLDLNFSNIVKC
jgi:hypothetical protein